MRHFLLALPLILSVASAASISDAEEQLAQGDWAAAARTAEAVGGVEGLNLAAKAYVLGASTDRAGRHP
ncbi:hypothetical protein [Deinococcus soli (ex Cha et al. 2016)]|uniref:hypothetical protein n=1 Tax=Deinococcus soli (ex Cha et al. 2016) TaxID=1309411 RepID=UPI0016658B62|nr:hypothetical protein [Deinococcus soli (ex Cha et al. 2016)]GGB70485.1 hypothetical protein GCM10008019_28340 [Deinococcus soli (ex Cha et al. 2016)]